MRKEYSTPNLHIVALDATDVIATSTNSLSTVNDKADSSAQLGNDRDNPIWD